MILGYSVFELLVFLIVAAVCGGLIQALLGYSVGGCLISLILGFLGAWLGAWLAVQLGLPELYAFTFNGESYAIIWPIIGAVFFAIVLNLLVQRLLIGSTQQKTEVSEQIEQG